MNDLLEAGKCVIEEFRFDAITQKNLIRAFVESELCPCAVETFNAHDNRTIDLTMEALYRAVINEMVLRGLATKMAEAATAIAHRPVEAEGRNGSGGATGCAAKPTE